MHDFPPLVPDMAGLDSATDTTLTQSEPAVVRWRLPKRDFRNIDTRSASRFLGWLMWQQLPALVLSSLIAVVEWLPGSVGPYIIGKIVDDGIVPHDMGSKEARCRRAGVAAHLGMQGAQTTVRDGIRMSTPVQASSI